jgi:hypothetical protein
MRVLRVTLAGTVALVLAGGMPLVTMAQEAAADPMASAAVTGTMVAATDISEGTRTVESGFVHIEGIEVMDTYEASDPRLSGEMTKTGTMHSYDGGFSVWANSVVLDNEAGRWVGTANGFWDRSAGCAYTMTMNGEGAYEGLTAYLVEDCGPDPITFSGVIVPGGMPPFPEPTE